jgi:cysteine desulfurase
MTGPPPHRPVYLDYAATTPTDPRVAEVMRHYATAVYGNPSSLHFAGREARRALDDARATLAACLGAEPQEIIFTGSGSEADNLALVGVAQAHPGTGRHILVSSIEHHAILETAKYLATRGFEVELLPVDADGLVAPDTLRQALRPDSFLVSIMHANNEIGTVQPIGELAAMAHAHHCLFHTDAVQTVGQLPVDVRALDVDLLTFSAHKFYGPKGVGGLYVRAGVDLEPLIHGGFQEASRRAGTENVAGIVGAAKALELALQHLGEEAARLTRLRDRLWEQISRQIPEARLNGHPVRRLPNNVNVGFKGIEAEGLLLKLSQAGIAASMGSACTSEVLEASHVIRALGLPAEWERGVLRFTLGSQTAADDIDYTAETLARSVPEMRG